MCCQLVVTMQRQCFQHVLADAGSLSVKECRIKERRSSPKYPTRPKHTASQTKNIAKLDAASVCSSAGKMDSYSATIFPLFWACPVPLKTPFLPESSRNDCNRPLPQQER